MSHELYIRPIAVIHSDFPTKFGIPRQPRLAPSLQATIVFEPDFRVDEALRGLEDFSHLWLIWGFSENEGRNWSPTVRPPRLGGNVRVGVFASRSPFRPNGLGLSCVRLLSIQKDANRGTVLVVSGADMMDGTPIYDIKPYLPYTDCCPEAVGGFAPDEGKLLDVLFPEELEALVPAEKREGLRAVLAHDPRPSYQRDPERIYGMPFAGLEIRFRADGALLTVVSVESVSNQR